MILKGYRPALAWSLIILLLTGLPGNAFPEIPNFLEWLSPDKIVHLVIFGMLTFLILWGYRDKYAGNYKKRLVYTAIIVTVLYGILTEVLQYYVFIGRSGNYFDALANTLGAFIGWWVFKKAIKKTKTIKS